VISSAALEVAVALILIYVVLSLVCSGLAQSSAQALGIRGRLQTAYIVKLFSGSSLTTEAGVELARAFYQHQLVQADIVFQADSGRLGPVSWRRRVYGTSRLQGARYTTAMLDLWTRAEGHVHRGPGTLEERIARMPGPQMQELLLALLDGAGGDEETFRADVAALFEYGQSLIDARHARYVQIFLEFWALTVVVLLNVDTVDIADALWSQTGDTASTQDRTLPIGWNMEEFALSFGAVVSKVVGLLLTVGAITYGAEFWLGVLERLGRAPNPKA
jgi:hypothetical protein